MHEKEKVRSSLSNEECIADLKARDMISHAESNSASFKDLNERHYSTYSCVRARVCEQVSR
jgi:hypothetical protein